MPSLSLKTPNDSDAARKLLHEIRLRVQFAERLKSELTKTWKDVEERVLAFLPAKEADMKRGAARESGLPQYTTIQVPYSYAVVMAAHTYLTSVFMGRSPMLQFTGRHGESQQQVQALEALMDYQTLVGRQLPYIYTWLYDVLKYGFGVIGVYWDERWENTTMIYEAEEVDPLSGVGTGRLNKFQETVQMRTYSGNRIYNVQPQDFIWDVRYPVREFQSGEFCGRKTKMGWNDLVRRMKAGYYVNIEMIGTSRGKDYYGASPGSDQLKRPELYSNMRDVDSLQSGLELKHPVFVGLYELVVEVIPKEWGLSESDYPEKWVFTCTDDFGVLIGVQPLGSFHAKFPYQVIPLEPEGYGITTRGLVEVLTPVQQTIDWLVNSHFYNVRAALNNKLIVDPSRVVMKDVLDPLPGGVIRLKPEAYGQDPRLIVHQMAVADVTQQHLPNAQFMFGIGERVAGVNDQIMGMLNTGGRKTATEVRTSTSFGVNRLKTIAEFSSSTGFDPLSQMMVQNTQQYYDMELQFKIAGDLLMGAGQSFVMVTPELISGFYNFVQVDGTQPIDRYAQANLWRELMREAAGIPQIGMKYDWGGIFEWVAQLAGLKNISQFKVEVAPDEMLMRQAQMGNVIPLSGSGAGGKSGAGANQPQRGIGPPA